MNKGIESIELIFVVLHGICDHDLNIIVVDTELNTNSLVFEHLPRTNGFLDRSIRGANNEEGDGGGNRVVVVVIVGCEEGRKERYVRS